MVRGSRHNHTVQFKHLYPKTGGGEDVDFVFQMKKFYKTNGFVAAVPEAEVNHPYWNNGGTSNGDSLVLSEWPEKTFLVFPNWIESTFLVVLVYGGFWWKYMTSDTTILSLVGECGSIAAIDHLVKILTYYGSTKGHVDGEKNRVVVWVHRIVLAFGASTVISSQKITRALCKVKCGSLCAFAHRMD
jgi:hypothetical protein